ncbi:Hpt domain-containing protein [Marinovum sp. 2_MG-2023]|nr:MULTISPECIES: Hpt domain-containing protein [unclassified Marinovum]MDO6729828.1 Hpt domain-containing protein [Marinovum sp. 2_MG-2023]MDO6779642.1 Hpt domain-containing protein [Marinovum sp. 1_MG-2023]
MIDWARVSELREEIGEEDFAEVVELFLEEVDGVMDTLVSDHEDLESQLHFLKGSAMNLGFDRFAALCQSGETAAGAGNGASVDTNHIREVYIASRAEFASGLETRLAG